MKSSLWIKLLRVIFVILLVLSVCSMCNSIRARASTKKKPKLSKTELTLRKDNQATLKVKNYSKKVKWKSSNKKIAKVDQQGVVTAVDVGEATITAKAGKTKLTCKVKVIHKPSLSQKKLTMNIDDKAELTVNHYKKEVTWKSLDKTIAKVNKNGKVTAILDGSTVIVATAGKYTLKCKVTVKKPSVKISTITIKKYKSKTIKVYNYSQPKFTSSKATIASVDSTGKVTGNRLGEVVIKITTGPYKFVVTATVEPYEPLSKNYVKLLERYNQGFKTYGEYYIYSFPKAEPSWDRSIEKAKNKKKTGTTCVVPARWGLVDMGLPYSGFYAKNGKFQKWQKNADYWVLIKSGKPVGLTIKQAVDQGKLKEGDLIAWKDRTHTVVYSGKGYYVYEGGSIPKKAGYKNGIKINYVKTHYKKYKISQVLRWKQ